MTAAIQDRRDQSQMAVAEVMEDLVSMFELVGRKLLTCDTLIQKKDAKQQEALRALQKNRAALQKQRLEKKREHAEQQPFLEKNN